jgi:hypothetical protein
MLGHENPQVTLRVYAELFDTDLDTVCPNGVQDGSFHRATRLRGLRQRDAPSPTPRRRPARRARHDDYALSRRPRPARFQAGM